MKKVLFATTALVATASVAAADVSFSGYGRFGVIYQDTPAVAATGTAAQIAAAQAAATASAAASAAAAATVATNTANGTLTAADIAAADAAAATAANDAAALDAIDGTAGDDSVDITSRFRLQIDVSAESDSGITFGARARIQQNETDAVAEAGNSGTGINGVRFFARSGGLEVGVGNIFGAIEFMPGQYPIDLGLTGLGYDYTAYAFGADAYSSGGAGSAGSNGVEAIYSAGDLSIHVSASDTNDRVAGHIAYTFSGWTAALGVQDSDLATDTEVTASIGGSIGPADVFLTWADNGTNGDHVVLAAKFDVGAATNIEAYIADADNQPDTGYGIDFNHDLGGGTSLRGGIAKRLSGGTSADFGVRFNF
ncbi:porin [uncultured Sulfitobacter sp.]|uniref:porin n=1 Tax=uncultured Sulfitobacter sp. TaxID=191468 RepID=UPI0026124D68|nr:porin [uncultured Sulfitobacter sp.]